MVGKTPNDDARAVTNPCSRASFLGERTASTGSRVTPVVNACVNLRRNKFDPPLFSTCSYSQLTTSKVPAHVCAATQQMNAATPPCGKSSPPGHAVVDGWRRDERTRDILQSLPRSLVSSAKPTTGVQVVRPAAPQCLDSLTPDASRAGPLHPRPRQFASSPAQAWRAPR